MIRSLFSKVQLIMFDGLTKEVCVASHLIGKQILHLGKKSGWLFAALYLKQCSVLLMTFRASDDPRLPTDLSVPVSLTFSGLPRIIPSFHRAEIRRRSAKGDQLIKFYLSVFSLAKLFELGKRVSSKTFLSIVSPVADLDTAIDQVNLIKGNMRELIYRYVPSIRTLPLFQGLRFKPTWKTLPTCTLTQQILVKRFISRAKRINSCFVSLPFELSSWVHLLTFVHSRGVVTIGLLEYVTLLIQVRNVTVVWIWIGSNKELVLIYLPVMI